MNSFTFDEITLGQTAVFTATVSQNDMDAFCSITGDISPLHMSDAYAARRGYVGRVVYGMLPASYFSALAGVYLPGEHCLLHSVEAKFTAPVFVGDTLTVSGTVTEKEELFKQITIKGRITNAAGKTVCRGIIKAGVAK